MYRTQHKAGYFLNSILDLFINDTEKQKIISIVDSLCYFSLETSTDIKHEDSLYSSEIKTINNLITQGTPGTASIYIEEVLSSTFGFTKKQINEIGKINYPFNNSEELLDELHDALHIIDPRINKENQTANIREEDWKDKKNGLKLDFQYSLIPEYLGKAFLQLIDTNRTYKSFIESSKYAGSLSKIEKKYNKILQNKCDFCLEMPYEHQNSKGISIELDDSPTNTKYDYEIEQLKDSYCKQLKFAKPLLIDTQGNTERAAMMRPIIGFTYNKYFDTISKNYRSPLYNSDNGLDAMQYALSPPAIARIQKTVVEYLLAGKLNLLDQKWNIAVIERDIPCAHLAFQDLKLKFENLFALKGDNFKFPEINLSIYRTKEFKKAKLNTVYPGNIKSLKNFDADANYDLLIDISVLQREGVINTPYKSAAKNTAYIRTAKNTNTRNKLLSNKAISYIDIYSDKHSEKIRDKALKATKYFLNNIFRQDVFMPSQLNLLNKMLQRQNVLGMLPTGGGKTIAYQLSAMLQPGVSIIINPIMSVMLDQVETLKKHNIDNCIFINDSIKNREKEDKILKQIGRGEYQFIFVSPDYLHRKEFRDIAHTMQYNNVYISQFVIDEAHCLSEWSHDFRPLYNDLGRIKSMLFANKNNQNIPTFALSAMVSYSCLNDLQKSLEIDTKNIIRISESNSKLNFNIIDTTSNQIKPDMSIDKIQNVVGGRKQVHISFLIKELLNNKTGNKKSLVYCPEAYGEMGVSDNLGDGLADKLENSFDNLKIGRFWGTTDDGTDNVPLYDARKSEKDYIKFINNQSDILISTKAFGIGSNKPDIANIIFFSPPFSTEGFIQQSYRIGRNAEAANCFLSIDKQEFNIDKNDPVSQYLKTDKCNYDKYIAYKEILKTYKGKEKELRIINELLYNIDHATASYKDIIKDEVKHEYQTTVDLELLPADQPNRLYVNEKVKTYGYIDLNNLEVVCKDSNFEQDISHEILSFVANEIEKRSHISKQYANLLQQKIYIKQSKGIIKDTENLQTGKISELTIPYKNNAIDKIAELLITKISNSFNNDLIEDFYTKTNSFDTFTEQIARIKSIDKNKKLKEEIKQLYLSVRLKNDTFLSIHRLSKLGIIQDYLIDDIKHCFILKVKKPTKESYLLKLYDILDDYLLSSKVSEYKNTISKIKDDYIGETLKIYINFCYDYVVQERFNSIENLHKIISKFPDNKDINKELNNNLKKYLDNYFTARYSNSYFNTIGNESLNAGAQNFTLMKNYFAEMGVLNENWLQLKHSAQLIAKEDANNFIVQLIDAHTDLIFGATNEDIIDKSFDKVVRGFITMRKQANFNIDNYYNDIETFLNYLYEIRPDLKQSYEALFWLRLHSVWLKDFNKKTNGHKSEVVSRKS